MKFLEIFRFEINYQARRISTWIYFSLLLIVSFQMARSVFVPEALEGGYFINAPFAIAQVTFVACIMSLLPLAALAGSAATRDIESRIHPLIYTTPIKKIAYLGGRFLAAFTLGAVVTATIPIGLFFAALLPGDQANLVGDIYPNAYLSAFFILILPYVLVSMAIMFAAAIFTRRAVVSYLGAASILMTVVISRQVLAEILGVWEIAKLAEPMGITVFGELSKIWTPAEKNTLTVGTQTWLLANRAVWLSIALAILGIIWLRFQFAHTGIEKRRWFQRQSENVEAVAKISEHTSETDQTLKIPRVERIFNAATRFYQLSAVARESFWLIIKGFGGFALIALALFVNLIAPLIFQDDGFPQIPTTGEFVNILEQTNEHGMWLITPLLIVYYAGELIWREREFRINEIIGASPVPTWVSLAGKFFGLALALLAVQTVMMASAMLAQALMGYYNFEIGLYARVLFGLRLTDFLLFALLAFIIQIIVNQKYISHLIVVVFYVLAVFGPQFGVEPGLLIYGSDPSWTYSDMRGFDPFLAPWLLFKFYWAAWALLLAVAANLLLTRGTEQQFGQRIRVARQRLTPPAVWTAAIAAVMILTFGSLIFYNTSVLHTSQTSSESAKLNAEYEQRYGIYSRVPQPRLTATNLQIDIYPKRGAAEIRGTYDLLNNTQTTIDQIHIAIVSEVETHLKFEPLATLEVDDARLRHRIYRLATPLRPSESLKIEFAVRYEPKGFPRQNINASIVSNGTFFGNEWLPDIGYQKNREIDDELQRREFGLPDRPKYSTPEDSEALMDIAGLEPIMFEAIVSTDEGQIALAPGSLRRKWTENNRSYFHYATDAPIRNKVAFFSADYAVREERWNDIEIQIFHHPEHTLNLDRMMNSIKKSLELMSERLGAYPHRQIRFVEQPGRDRTLFANPVNIRYEEGFSFINVNDDPRDIDLPFAVSAHEVAHQWWGHQIAPAQVLGAPVLNESLAWYSALEIVEANYGREHRERLLGAMREDLLTPRPRAATSLLRSNTRFQWYRKGVIAFCTLREYIGSERMDTALRRFFDKYRSGKPPLPTTYDLYKELQSVTPEELQYLLTDLFEANTFWELETKNIEKVPTTNGEWQVTLDVSARKIVVDEQGVETEIPMNDLIEVGAFSASTAGDSEPLYLQMHRIRSGEQRITLTVPKEPSRAGIDPRHRLIDLEPDDNFKAIN